MTIDPPPQKKNIYIYNIIKKFARAGIEPGIFWFVFQKFSLPLLLTYIGSLKLLLSIKLWRSKLAWLWATFF